MSFNLKTYKLLKIKYYFKKINFFFFFYGVSLNKTNWTKIEQLLNKEELKYFQILNSLMVKITKSSIFKNLATLIHGPTLFIHTNNNNNNELTLKKLNSISVLINLLCLKLNNKIYSKKQVKNLKKLSYKENIFLFYSYMQTTIRMPYYKLKVKN